MAQDRKNKGIVKDKSYAAYRLAAELVGSRAERDWFDLFQRELSVHWQDGLDHAVYYKIAAGLKHKRFNPETRREL